MFTCCLVLCANNVNISRPPEKVLGTRGPHCWPVPLRDSQTHQVGSGEGPLFVLFQFHSTKRCVACCMMCVNEEFVVRLFSHDYVASYLTAALMSTVYEEQKDEDGFLYIQYSGESTFGSD